MASPIQVQNLSFEFSNGTKIFDKLNFSLRNCITALVGPNGIGKSCLARLLSGELEASQGKILKSEEISYFPQFLSKPDMSIYDFLADEDFSWNQLKQSLLNNLDLNLNCKNLSGGEWMRVRLAREIKGHFIILDEPTNDLDREGRTHLLHFLRNYEAGVLLISHDRECLKLCAEVLELSNKGLKKYGLSWDDYERAQEIERDTLKENLERATHQRASVRKGRVELMERQEKRNRKGAKDAAKGGMPKILIGARKRQAQKTTADVHVRTLAQAERAVAEAYSAFSEIKLEPVMYADIQGQTVPTQKLVAEAQGFNFNFSHKVYPKNLNFVWRGPIRLALKGKNGSGKSSLVKALLGANLSFEGSLKFGNLRTLYIDQEYATLDFSLSIFENVRQSCYLDEVEIRNRLAYFLFTKDDVFKKVSLLSGGEKLRAALAKGLLANEKPELLILDEPTNNLDMANIKFVEKLASNFKGALIVISHDEVFLENCKLEEDFYLDNYSCL